MNIRQFSGWSWVGVLAAAVLTPACAADEIGDLLAKLETRRAAVKTLHHAVKVKSIEGDVTREVTTEVWEQRDGDLTKTRIERATRTSGGDSKTAKSKQDLRTVTVSDGKREWREIPMGTSVMVVKTTPAPVPAFQEIRSAIRGGKARLAEKATVDGHACLVIEVVGGEEGDRFKGSYWITERHGVVLKSVVKRSDRSTTERTTTVFEVDKPVDSAKFVYTAPEGAVVVDTDTMGSTPKKASP